MMKQNELNQKLVNHAKYFQNEVRKNIAIAISAAFAFILALYWKDLITEGVNKVLDYLKLSGNSFYFRVFVALIVTLICVFGIIIITKWGQIKNK
ncbi:hypothetical protein HYU07_04580 [Candidatus Woesearchaeota archaeon]|nr:hypothetical protein [Candidatus Woesearchaeota archaeon]